MSNTVVGGIVETPSQQVLLSDADFDVIPKQSLYGAVTPNTLIDTLFSIPHEKRYSFSPDEVKLREHRKYGVDVIKLNLQHWVKLKVLNAINGHFAVNAEEPLVQTFFDEREKKEGSPRIVLGLLLCKKPLFRRFFDELKAFGTKKVSIIEAKQRILPLLDNRGIEPEYAFTTIARLLDETKIIKYLYMKRQIILLDTTAKPVQISLVTPPTALSEQQRIFWITDEAGKKVYPIQKEKIGKLLQEEPLEKLAQLVKNDLPMREELEKLKQKLIELLLK